MKESKLGRQARQAAETGLYHVVSRGNNKQRLFHKQEDFKAYLELLKSFTEKHDIQIHHYCLMSNHVHLLLRSEYVELVSKCMHGIQRGYHHYYRKAYTFFGHLFQGRFRSLPIEDEGYLLECGRYIERNPVRAKMVKNPEDWFYSSYRYYAFNEADELIEPSVAYLALSKNLEMRQKLYQGHVNVSRPYEQIIDKELVGK